MATNPPPSRASTTRGEDQTVLYPLNPFDQYNRPQNHLFFVPVYSTMRGRYDRAPFPPRRPLHPQRTPPKRFITRRHGRRWCLPCFRRGHRDAATLFNARVIAGHSIGASWIDEMRIFVRGEGRIAARVSTINGDAREPAAEFISIFCMALVAERPQRTKKSFTKFSPEALFAV